MEDGPYLLGWWLCLAGYAGVLTWATQPGVGWNLWRRLLAGLLAVLGIVAIPYGLLIFFFRDEAPSPLDFVGSRAAPVALLLFVVASLPVSVRVANRGPMRLMWFSLAVLAVAFIMIVSSHA